MKVIAVIPARYASTRFPGKLMKKLGDKTVIATTYEAVKATQLFDTVVVATDHADIADAIRSIGGTVFMSQREHESGSDRIAEAVAEMEADVVINVQGDEPFVDRAALEALVSVFKNDTQKQIDLASLMFPLTETDAIANPNNVKVVTDLQGRALYFSRSPIPHLREGGEPTDYFQHVGVYAFRREALLDFSQWQPSRLELSEKLEQLRYLENGRRIQMVRIAHKSVGIDTPEDLEQARTLWNQSMR